MFQITILTTDKSRSDLTITPTSMEYNRFIRMRENPFSVLLLNGLTH